MTFLSLEQVKALFRGSFEIETLRETEEDGEASTGLKHWHVFEVIARKMVPTVALHSGGYR